MGSEVSLAPMAEARQVPCGTSGCRRGASPCLPPATLAALGTLEFTLLFDADNSALHCTAHRAKVRTEAEFLGWDKPQVSLQPFSVSRASSHQLQALWTPMSKPICCQEPAR